MTGRDDPADGMPGDDALAADFALGALGHDERRAAEARIAREPALAAAVLAWQTLLAPLDEATPPVVPAAAVWERIAAATVDAGRAPARAPTVASPSMASRFWSSLATWRALTAASSLVAATAVALLVARPAPVAAPPGALLTASLAATGQSAAVLINATFDPVRGAVILTPAAADASAGRSPELWLIVGTAAPRSLGLIDLAAPRAHAIPADLRPLLTRGATLAISLEPAGGSPTGLPTGPVVAAGKLAAI